MENRSTKSWLAFTGAVTLVVLTMGCATKKYVRNNLEPLEARLGKTEEATSDNSRRITEVDQNAQAGITDAKSRANSAAADAAQADQRAQGAESLAQKGLTETDRIREELRNADNFQLLKTETVHFGFNKSDLDAGALQTLDSLASLAKGNKKYVIEVEGFTDQIGSETYNLELSRQRADAVVRYLTLVHKLPLARIFRVGYGEEQPVATNDSREGREQNRRVEIRFLAVQQASGQAMQAQANQPGQE